MWRRVKVGLANMHVKGVFLLLYAELGFSMAHCIWRLEGIWVG